MPRRRRHIITGCAHHVINRGNDRRRLFSTRDDYETFLRLLWLGKQRSEVKVFGMCVMPNHFHGIVQPDCDGALSHYLHWVLGNYAAAFRSRTGTVGHGHVFQRRFWSDPIKDSLQFLTVLRYVEANPWRAHLVTRAEEWPWSSVTLREQCKLFSLLDPLPFELPDKWIDVVNQQQPTAELKTVRGPALRGRPPKASRGDAGIGKQPGDN
jgi:putative transposase